MKNERRRKRRKEGRGSREGERNASCQLPDVWAEARTVISWGMKASAAGWIRATGWQRQMAAEGDGSLGKLHRVSINLARLNLSRHLPAPAALRRFQPISSHINHEMQTSASSWCRLHTHKGDVFKQRKWANGCIQWDTFVCNRNVFKVLISCCHSPFSQWSIGSRFIFLITFFPSLRAAERFPCFHAIPSCSLHPVECSSYT